VAQEAVLNKAPDAFRTISEVAADLDLPQHVLRFWESRFPHVKPLKRGGGRRYYRPEDIDLLRGIRRLLYADGYTIRGVQRILREQGVRTVQSVGQGQAPNIALPRDGGEDGHGGDAALATVKFLSPPLLYPKDDDAKDDGGEPPAHPSGRPRNGLIADDSVIVPVTAAPDGARAEARGDSVSIAAALVAVAPVAATPVGATRSAPSGMAVQDLEKLKQALAALEACRRLLDKVMEEGP
jgi:DNA-binding transcriptional MerR regulator